MLKKVLHFVKYNNAFPIALSLILLGTSVSFAASEDLRETIVDSQDVVRSVDNNFIISVDLDNFDFDLQITDVVEDDNGYNVSYSYQTIAIEDYTWKVVRINKTLGISRVALESSYLKDLGLYVAKNLGDNLNSELVYLKRVKELETAKGSSNKIVTTEYSGLIGKHLDHKEKVFEGYYATIEPVSKEEIAEKMSPEEISAKTRTVLQERKMAKQLEEQRLAEEKKKQDGADLLSQTATSTNISSGGEVLGETSSNIGSTTTNQGGSPGTETQNNTSSTTPTEQESTTTSTTEPTTPAETTPPAVETPPDTTPPPTETTPPTETLPPAEPEPPVVETPPDATPPPTTEPNP